LETLIAILIGILYAAGIYSMLRRSLMKLVIGLILISQATNLLIFDAAGLPRGRPPLVAEGVSVPAAPYADPIPQALILTAIVISFGVLAFVLVLMHRAHKSIGTDDLDEMKGTDS